MINPLLEDQNRYIKVNSDREMDLQFFDFRDQMDISMPVANSSLAIKPSNLKNSRFATNNLWLIN